MLIEIEGINTKSIEETSTASSGGGLRPFPCDANGWTKQTGVVMKAGIKSFDYQGTTKDNISILVANGAYGGEILIGLNPNDIPTGLTPEKAAKARENNLKTIMLAIKILGCHTGGKLDTTKLEKARGMCVELIAKHKGFQQSKDGSRHYHKVQLLLTGQVDQEGPVTEVPMPPLPGGALPSAPAGGYADDLPF